MKLVVGCLPWLGLLAGCAAEPRTPTLNQPPIPVLAAPASARVGEAVTLDGEASLDLDGIVADVFILPGDGTPPVNQIRAEHAFSQPGLYLVELLLQDDDGATSRARHRIVVAE